MDPPETPISAATCAKEGLPFYNRYNEVASDIKGDFEGVNSVKAIEKARDKASGKRPIILLNPDGTSFKFRPVAELETEILSKNADELFGSLNKKGV